jgi:hypothetical protein
MLFLMYTNMKKKEEKLILEGILQKFSPMTYPGRIYGMYDWDWKENKWIVNENFCKEHGIEIKK